MSENNLKKLIATLILLGSFSVFAENDIACNSYGFDCFDQEQNLCVNHLQIRQRGQLSSSTQDDFNTELANDGYEFWKIYYPSLVQEFQAEYDRNPEKINLKKYEDILLICR